MDNDELTSLAADLLTVRRLAREPSLKRGTADRAALPLLADVRSRLRALLKEYPQNSALWKLSSEVEEVLLNTRAAIRALEKFMELSGCRDRLVLKKLAALRSELGDWEAVRLSREQLLALERYLLSEGVDLDAEDHPTQGTLSKTMGWLSQQPDLDEEGLLKDFERAGGLTDYTVLMNVCRR